MSSVHFRIQVTGEIAGNGVEQMKTVIVLGAPRSGTSMTAGVLNLLGVAMGHVRRPDPLNPTGYFEDREFLKLADDVFSAAMPGAHGFRLPPPEALEQVRGHFDDRIQELTTRRMQECSSNMWGWKACGVSLFAEEFLPFTPNPHVVVVLRNPASVAKSVVRYVRHDEKKHMYEELSLVEALQVIGQYERSIYGFIGRHPDIPHIVLAYEEVVADPEAAVRSLSSFLGIDTTSKATRRAIKFVSSRRPTASHALKKDYLPSVMQRIIRRFSLLRSFNAMRRGSK
jgi:hypothetical protein